MTYEELLRDYGRAIGIQDMEIDSAGAMFEIDDFPVVVRPDDGSQRITLMAEVGEVAPDRQAAVALKLLKLNYAAILNGGMAAGQNGNMYYWMTSLPLAGLDAQRFETEILALVKKGQAARSLLQTEAQLAQAQASRERAQAASGSEPAIRI